MKTTQNDVMIEQSKKDEVSVLTAPTQAMFVSFDDSVFKSLGKQGGPVCVEAAVKGDAQNFWTNGERQIHVRLQILQ